MSADIFDGSFAFSIKTHSEIEEISLEKIKLFVQCVLDHVFGSGHKTTIEDFKERLNFACPYCLDSSKDVFKKRGNLFYKNMMFKCFNCGTRESLYAFLKDYQTHCNIDDETLYVLKTYQTSINVQRKRELNFFDKELLKTVAFSRDDLKATFGFIDIKGTEGEKFLNARYQKQLDNFLYYPKTKSIVILNCIDDIILGYQLRSLKQKRYFTYKLSKIYEEANRQVTDSITKMDDISTIFNILQLDFNRPVTVFEGPMDSFLYGNSIAISGAHNILEFEIENMRFWFDNDDTGKRLAMANLKEGHEVFLWKKYLRDMDINTQVKDLNDLVIYSKKNDKLLLPFDRYFSNNKLNMYYV